MLKAGQKLQSDNVHGLELAMAHGVALPGSDDSIRGLTLDGWIIADEAARLLEDLIAALRPMRARRPQARLAMLSTAWNRSDPFWTASASDDPSFIRIKATADRCVICTRLPRQERRALGEPAFKREYLGIPGGEAESPLTWELYEQAIYIHVPKVRPGRVCTTAGSKTHTLPNPFQHLRSL